MRFRKKAVVIEAMQWDGSDDCFFELGKWSDRHVFMSSDGLMVRTLEGSLLATNGDWIIRGVKGEYYPCKPDIFEQTYERVDNEDPHAK